MKFWKQLCCLGLAAVAMLSVAGCGGSSPESSSSGKMQKLSIGLMPDTDSLPFLIAEEKGYFADEGLEVDLKQFKSAMDRDSALQSGNLDGAVVRAVVDDQNFDLVDTLDLSRNGAQHERQSGLFVETGNLDDEFHDSLSTVTRVVESRCF